METADMAETADMVETAKLTITDLGIEERLMPTSYPCTSFLDPLPFDPSPSCPLLDSPYYRQLQLSYSQVQLGSVVEGTMQAQGSELNPIPPRGSWHL